MVYWEDLKKTSVKDNGQYGTDHGLFRKGQTVETVVDCQDSSRLQGQLQTVIITDSYRLARQLQTVADYKDHFRQ